MKAHPVPALAMIARVLGNPHTAGDLAPNTTCDEADTIAIGLAIGGHEEAAATWLYAHGDGDEDHNTIDTGDRHFGLTEDGALLLVRHLVEPLVEYVYGPEDIVDKEEEK